MILRSAVLDGIREGRITVAFRRWRRPSVRAGGTLLTAAGQLEIRDVVVIGDEAIAEDDARRAGYPSREALFADLGRGRGTDAALYRIEFGALRADPRVELRTRVPSEDELETVRANLLRLDARSATGAWTHRVLELIREHPARRAGDLAEMAGQDRLVFKTNVRKLKALGLTESLGVGYRLSPRGEAVLAKSGR